MKETKKNTNTRIEIPCAGGLTLVAEKGSDPGYNEIFITLEKDGEWFRDLAMAGQDYTYRKDNEVVNDPSCYRVCVWGDTSEGPADDFTEEIRVHVDPSSGDDAASPGPEKEPQPTLEQVRDAYLAYARWTFMEPSHAGAIMLDTETGEIWADCFFSAGDTKVYASPSILRVPADDLFWDVAGMTKNTDEAMPETIHAWIHALLPAEADRKELEPLFTDPEYRLLLAALSREKEVCRKTDLESPGDVDLERLMDSISKKIADVQYGRGCGRWKS